MDNPSKRMRLNRYLASCGLGTRKEAEGIISSGRISVNGALVTSLGSRVDPEVDKVTMDGKLIQKKSFVYLLFNRPKGWMENQSNLSNLLGPSHRGLGLVGLSLDEDSCGLELLTNDPSITELIKRGSKKGSFLYQK